jgi:hypothetical protein
VFLLILVLLVFLVFLVFLVLLVFLVSLVVGAAIERDWETCEDCSRFLAIAFGVNGVAASAPAWSERAVESQPRCSWSSRSGSGTTISP